MVPLGCLVLLLSANMVLVLTFHQDLQDGNFFIDAEDIFSSAGGGVEGPLYYCNCTVLYCTVLQVGVWRGLCTTPARARG